MKVSIQEPSTWSDIFFRFILKKICMELLRKYYIDWVENLICPSH